MSSFEDMIVRFGKPEDYHKFFLTLPLEHSHIRRHFGKLHSNRHHMMGDNYELSRQNFLHLLSQNKMTWYPTNEDLDLNVEVSRIYCQDRNEYIAFMRIHPKGFRGERCVPADMEMVFHLLLGKVIFINRGRTKMLSKGQFTTVRAKANYSVRSISEDQPAYLVFRIVRHKKK